MPSQSLSSNRYPPANSPQFIYTERDVICKRRIRDNIGPLLDEVSHLTNRDVDKAETLNAFFSSVFNTSYGPWDPPEPYVERP
ncbi:hypothetical protein QYF61_013313 [Mycteria americana]|uniref:Uncharacterized protein n=1 Tax=Mycteria americana TaxID=33587 RepID=A0AAN7RPK5_MYCAM|nr:hypothetical protein QYF61_013313 [Mycteria americana]